MNDLSTLPQLEVEIKFYLGQTAQNIIEVGKRLIQAKSLVQHGQWLNWLKNNFDLTVRTADRFITCAERFSKLDDVVQFKPSQLTELLSLPDAEETERFIAQKAAEGKKVDEMTIRQLRNEIAEYKNKLEQSEQDYQQSLFTFEAKVDNLQRKLDEKPTVIEKLPEDYATTKSELITAQNELSKANEQISTLESQIELAKKRIDKITKEKKRSEEIQKQLYDINQRNIELSEKLFDVIVIDPPWGYIRQAHHGSFDANGRRGTNPYPEMTQEELKAIELPAANDSVLFLWTTHKFIWDAKELLDHWGFDYRCMLVWNKEQMGLGNFIRMQCEFCLIGLKGKPTFNDIHNIRDLIEEPRREHSRKPEAFYKLVEELCTGRKLDYFSRQQREGWWSYGNDTNKFTVA